MVKPCFGANEDVWVVCGDEVTKFGRFVLDTLEMYIDYFERFERHVFVLLLWLESPVCCWWEMY